MDDSASIRTVVGIALRGEGYQVIEAKDGQDAINKLTPPSENDTVKYLADLKKAGVDLTKTVKSQIDVLMPAVEANEGLITGTVVPRTP